MAHMVTCRQLFDLTRPGSCLPGHDGAWVLIQVTLTDAALLSGARAALMEPEDGGAGFKTLGLRLHKSSPHVCSIYLKQHAANGVGEVPHTIFVAGLPLGVDQSSLQAVFECFGDVAQVVLHSTKVGGAPVAYTNSRGPQIMGCNLGSWGLPGLTPHHTGPLPPCAQRSGVVVFADGTGAATALQHAGSGEIVEYELPTPEGPIGLKAWVAAHKAARPGNAALQQQVRWRAHAHRASTSCPCPLPPPVCRNPLSTIMPPPTTQIDKWIADWEAEQEAEAQRKRSAMAEEGWTMVVRSKVRTAGRQRRSAHMSAPWLAVLGASTALVHAAPQAPCTPCALLCPPPLSHALRPCTCTRHASCHAGPQAGAGRGRRRQRRGGAGCSPGRRRGQAEGGPQGGGLLPLPAAGQAAQRWGPAHGTAGCRVALGACPGPTCSPHLMAAP